MKKAHNRLDQHLRKFNRMDTAELGLFLRAWFGLFAWWIRLRMGSLPDSLAADRPGESRRAPPDACQRSIRECQLAVNRAENYHFLRGNCLLRSLTLQTLLRARGVDSQLRFGVRTDSAKSLEAHAWLEVGDLALGRSVPGEPDYGRLGRNA